VQLCHCAAKVQKISSTLKRPKISTRSDRSVPSDIFKNMIGSAGKKGRVLLHPQSWRFTEALISRLKSLLVANIEEWEVKSTDAEALECF
jgi:hypothetical protein